MYMKNKYRKSKKKFIRKKTKFIRKKQNTYKKGRKGRGTESSAFRQQNSTILSSKIKNLKKVYATKQQAEHYIDLFQKYLNDNEYSIDPKKPNKELMDIIKGFVSNYYPSGIQILPTLTNTQYLLLIEDEYAFRKVQLADINSRLPNINATLLKYQEELKKALKYEKTHKVYKESPKSSTF